MAQLNKRWKDLDPIFKCLLRKYVTENLTDKFHALADALALDKFHALFIWDALEAAENHDQQLQKSSESKHKKRESGHKRKKRTHTPPLDDIDSDFGGQKDIDDDDTDEDSVRPKRKKKKSESEEQLFMVHSILRHRIQDKGYEYCVKWVGYDDPTWEPSRNLKDDSVKHYFKSKGLKLNKKGAIVALDAYVDKAHKSRSNSKSKK
eukprot:369829_1